MISRLGRASLPPMTPSVRLLRTRPLRLRPWPTTLTAALQQVAFSRPASSQSASKPSCCSKAKEATPPPVISWDFWASRPTWKRAGVNTFRCLVGCTLGDFSAMWYLQSFHPEMAVESVMAVSMASGLTTSLLLETVLLKLGKDKLPWAVAARTAAGMSMISMITMELAENAVDYHLTGGVVQLQDPAFWGAALVSIGAGFLASLPYNYHRLRKFGKACH